MVGPVNVLVLDTPGKAVEMAEQLEKCEPRLNTTTEQAATQGWNRLADGNVDCVISANDLQNGTGISFLESVRTAYPDLPFILTVEEDSEAVATAAAEAGATDYTADHFESHFYPVLAEKLVRLADLYRSTQVMNSSKLNWTSSDDRVSDVYFAFSGDWETLLYINEAYEEMWGSSVCELQAAPKSFLENIHPADQEVAIAAMERLSAGEPAEFEYRVRSATGDKRWVHGVGQPTVDADGNVRRIFGSVKDITPLKEHGQQLQVLTRVLRHNISNRMNVIAGFAEIIAAEANGDVAAYAERISGAADDLVELTTKQKRIVELVTESVNRIASDIATDTRRQIETFAEAFPDAEFSWDIPDEAEALVVNDIDYAVEQLIENAVIHSHDTPVVDVSVTEDTETVTISVTDNNEQIPRLEIAVITGEVDIDQLSHSRGLGLWLVNWLVAESGGTATFEALPAGNRIQLSLPKV